MKTDVNEASVESVVSTRIDPGELAFEKGFDESPQFLWRVYSVRDFKGRDIRHTNWFASEQAAKDHADWINDGRGRVLSVTKYQSC